MIGRRRFRIGQSWGRQAAARALLDDMELVFQLGGAGWADARMSDGSRGRDMRVSYLCDALGEMARAALHLLRGSREAVFAFDDEPGEHRWVLTRGEADSLSIRIFWFDETFSSRRLGKGTEVFSCDCAVLDFVGPVFSVLHQILSNEGVEGYKRRWKNNEFPLDTYNEIRRLLAPRPQ